MTIFHRGCEGGKGPLGSKLCVRAPDPAQPLDPHNLLRSFHGNIRGKTKWENQHGIHLAYLWDFHGLREVFQEFGRGNKGCRRRILNCPHLLTRVSFRGEKGARMLQSTRSRHEC